MKKKTLVSVNTLIFWVLLFAFTLLTNLNVPKMSFAKESTVSSEAMEFLGKLSDSLSEIAQDTQPSVVNISTTMTVSSRRTPFGDLFEDPFFRRFFGENFGPPQQFKSSALGSGVIINDDGYILTNNHVIKGADEIKVKLYDKREFKGQVIGTDSKTDLAVIKIDARGLPAIKIGDSDKLKVGDIVIAIGNPYALSHTITMGIVSAVGRSNVGIADYEDFIQTDAAINPGNSGGALVNTRGELVGINTAIFSTSGGYMGIGFAIPSSMAYSVMESIIQHGKVIRGWLGVTIQDLTPELAKQLNIQETKGSLVSDVVKNSPAEKAGFRRGDVIVDFDNKPIENSTILKKRVAETPPDTTVQVKIIRDGKEMPLTVTLDVLPETMEFTKSEYNNAMKGVHVQNLSDEIQDNFNIPYSVKGVIVTGVEQDSPAFGVLKQRDVIQEVDKKEIKNTKDYDAIVSMLGRKDSVLLLIYRAGGYIYLTINP
jgi:serine protease Do